MAMAVIFVSRCECHQIIANGLQAQYAVSADNVFLTQGGTTGINYEQMFNRMKVHTAKILQGRTPRDKETIEMWEGFLFNGSNLPQVASTEDYDGEDEFSVIDMLMDEEGKDSNFFRNIYYTQGAQRISLPPHLLHLPLDH